jgi:hypothetical protein
VFDGKSSDHRYSQLSSNMMGWMCHVHMYMLYTVHNTLRPLGGLDSLADTSLPIGRVLAARRRCSRRRTCQLRQAG